MFDRFTDHNKKIMSLSRLAALRLGHAYIGTEHMLLGLLECDGTVAAHVLEGLGVDRAALRARFESGLESGSAPLDQAGQLPFTPNAKRVLENAMAEASGLRHNWIGSEHLLLGLLATDGTDAEAALREAGITPGAVRAAVLEFLGEDPDRADRAEAPGALSDRLLLVAQIAAQGLRALPTGTRERHRLLLISNSTMHGGGYLAHCAAEIGDFLGERRRVAFVPYALADHDGYEAKAKAAFAALGHDLVSVHRAGDPRDAVREADAVFVGGGNTFRLLEALYRRQLVQPIRERVWGGMPYIGSSAGTNVATLSIKTTNDMPIVMPPTFLALALVPFQINPHYLDPDPGSRHMGETREERIVQFHEENDTPVLGLREGCMLRVEGEAMELRGTTRARLFRRGVDPAELAPPCDLSFLLQTPYPR